MGDTIIVPVSLSDGLTFNVEARAMVPISGFADRERLVSGSNTSLNGALNELEALGKALATTLEKIAPDTASVEFEIELGFEPGRLVALLVQGSGKANLKVTLGWARHTPSN